MTTRKYGSNIGRPYAEALYQLGLSFFIEKNNSTEFFKIVFDMQDLSTLLKTTPIVSEYLSNPLISNDNKKVILMQCLGKKASTNTKNFLKLLVDKKRISYIEGITQVFLEKIYNFVCIKFIDLWATYDVSEPQQQRLINKLILFLEPDFSKCHGKLPKVNLTVKIDKNLLGGFILVMDSQIIDLSLKGELQRLAKQLEVTL
uniref:ATP synthase subunit delta, chloroplastic n=1 Tax=Schizocladia ischiensis TaxID=196139 RepID=A0A7S6ZPB6_9STRA|nr:AtpD [Schizocladia ischiensis]QOW07531.1 AtpD [Schizocladia ischiensis]